MKAKNILNCTHRNLCCTGHFCFPTFWDWFISNDNLDSRVFPHLIYQLSTPWYHLIEGLASSFISSNLLFVNIVLFVSSFLILINLAPLTYNRLIPSLRMSPLISFVIVDGSEKLKKRCHLPQIANPLKFYFFSPLLFSDVSSLCWICFCPSPPLNKKSLSPLWKFLKQDALVATSRTYLAISPELGKTTL